MQSCDSRYFYKISCPIQFLLVVLESKTIDIMNAKFKIPVCIFLFRRAETLPNIFEVLKIVKPEKLYLRSDEGRNDEEKKEVAKVRSLALNLIDWDCEVIKDFASENRGVYKNIGLGAIEIFKKEDKCIFIEDDNLPNESFFSYCEQMLDFYENDEQTLLICGTNYGGNKFANCKTDCFRVKALLPCGWASWSRKFVKYYPLHLEEVDSPNFKKDYFSKYKHKPLARQQFKSISFERNKYLTEGKFNSWDFHLIESIMMNDLYVISPKVNLIRNIGVDTYSTHNQINFKKYKRNIMTRRFCEVPTYSLDYKLNPEIDYRENAKYQKYCDHMICKPFNLRFKEWLVSIRNLVLRR